MRSESVLNGKIPMEPGEEFKQQKLHPDKKNLGERPGQLIPDEWPEKAEVPRDVLEIGR